MGSEMCIRDSWYAGPDGSVVTTGDRIGNGNQLWWVVEGGVAVDDPGGVGMYRREVRVPRSECVPHYCGCSLAALLCLWSVQLPSPHHSYFSPSRHDRLFNFSRRLFHYFFPSIVPIVDGASPLVFDPDIRADTLHNFL